MTSSFQQRVLNKLAKLELEKYKRLFIEVVAMAKEYESDCDFGTNCKILLQDAGFKPNWEEKTSFEEKKPKQGGAKK